MGTVPTHRGDGHPGYGGGYQMSLTSGNRVFQKSKSGLSGVAIAGIIIACLVFVAIIITVIELAKNGTSSGAKVTIDDNSSSNKISVDVNNSNLV